MGLNFTINRFVRTVVTVLFLLFPPVISAQEAVPTGETSTCAENLKSAQDLFNRGQVEQVPDILHDCMKSGFTREEELSAYKLLIQSFLFEDKLEQADSTMLEFLHKNPEYVLSPTDHSSFVYLYNKFSVKPLIQLSVHLGTNLPFVTFVDHKTVLSPEGKIDYSSGALNLYTSLEAKYKITKKLEVNLEAGYSQVRFTRVEENLNPLDTLFGKTYYTETQSRIEIPLTLTYDLKSFGKFTPYLRLGAGSAITMSSNATAEQKSVALLGGGPPHSGKEVSRTKSRIKTDVFVQAGGGIKFKTRGGYINAEIRMNAGSINQTVRGMAPEIEEDLVHTYYYVDDDFNLNTFNFSIGYTQIFYKASKRRE